MTAQIAIALMVGVAAIVDDISRRQIANWIPALAFVGGLSAMALEHGWRGAGSSLLGTVAGFAVFLIFYLLGGMGGGDVKLMAGFGAVLGAERLLEASLWTAAFGGLMAAGVLVVAAVRKRMQRPPAKEQGSDIKAIPYAPAIAIGAWLSLIPKV
jgi:prepilin peptidase CpaA